MSNSRHFSLDELDSYANAVAAVDGVITKPGYGIVADCLVHGTPVIYTDRGLFLEYDILVNEMSTHLATGLSAVAGPLRRAVAGCHRAAGEASLAGPFAPRERG